MKTTSAWAGLFLALLCISHTAQAATILTGESVQITSPIEGNVYVGAGKITIGALVNGDVTAGAGDLRVTDTIRRDLTVGAGRVRIEGVVGDDLRCGGGEVDLFGHVLGDVVIGSGQLEVARGAVIHGDLVVAGGEVRIYGKIMGDVIVAGGVVVFEGEAERDFSLRGGEVTVNGVVRGPSELAAGNLTLGSRAEFYQPVRYWQKDGELDFGTRLREGATATFDPDLKQDMGEYNKGWLLRTFSFFAFYRLIVGAILVALLLGIFGAFFRRSVEGLPTDWLSRFGAGILYLIGVPVAVVLLLVTVIGIPFALFALMVYLFSLAFAPAMAAVMVAITWERQRSLNWSNGQRILMAIAVLIALHLLTAIPVVGWLVGFVVFSIVLGTLVKSVTMRRATAP